MTILSWIMFGAVSGLIVNILDPYPSKEASLGAVILGVLGAILGGLLANLVVGITFSGFSLESILIAVSGSLMFLYISRAVKKT